MKSRIDEVKRLQKIAGIFNENIDEARKGATAMKKYQAAEDEWNRSGGEADIDALIQKYFKMSPEEFKQSQMHDDIMYDVMDKIEDGMGGEEFFNAFFPGESVDIDDEDDEDEDAFYEPQMAKSKTGKVEPIVAAILKDFSGEEKSGYAVTYLNDLGATEEDLNDVAASLDEQGVDVRYGMFSNKDHQWLLIKGEKSIPLTYNGRKWKQESSFYSDM